MTITRGGHGRGSKTRRRIPKARLVVTSRLWQVKHGAEDKRIQRHMNEGETKEGGNAEKNKTQKRVQKA